MPPADTSNDPAQAADRARREAGEEARRAGDEMRAAARGVRDHAGDAVRDAGRIARDEANARVGRAADGAAAEAERAATAAEDAAGDYPDRAMPGRTLEGVSAFLEDTAHSLRRADLESVADDVTRFARRHPLTFLAGAAAIGFAAARLARAAPQGDGRFDDAADRDETDHGDETGHGRPIGPDDAQGFRADPVPEQGPVQAQDIDSAVAMRTAKATGT
ncbi:MAG: hypothetical protein V2I65_12085 [Paracoccaceae bacterium]|jgi:hypothetical protein|nr:hypothetical protein [Paracoccaceae bacterium]